MKVIVSPNNKIGDGASQTVYKQNLIRFFKIAERIGY